MTHNDDVGSHAKQRIVSSGYNLTLDPGPWTLMQSSASSHLSMRQMKKRVGKDMGEGEGERWRRNSLPAC